MTKKGAVLRVLFVSLAHSYEILLYLQRAKKKQSKKKKATKKFISIAKRTIFNWPLASRSLCIILSKCVYVYRLEWNRLEQMGKQMISISTKSDRADWHHQLNKTRPSIRAEQQKFLMYMLSRWISDTRTYKHIQFDWVWN